MVRAVGRFVNGRICGAKGPGARFQRATLRTKLCTRVPNVLMRERMTWSDYASLATPHCALLVMNGDADTVIDTDADHSAWIGTQETMHAVEEIYSEHGVPGRSRAWFEASGGHRPYFLDQIALPWIHQHLGTPNASAQRIGAWPTWNAGVWLDAQGVKLEKLYGTDLHWRGATLPDAGVKLIAREELAALHPQGARPIDVHSGRLVATNPAAVKCYSPDSRIIGSITFVLRSTAKTTVRCSTPSGLLAVTGKTWRRSGMLNRAANEPSARSFTGVPASVT